jgi:protein-disulfide isomerase
MASLLRGSSGGWKLGLVGALLGILIGGGTMLAFNGYFIRSYLLQNPEILRDVAVRLQEREMAETIDQSRVQLEMPFHSAWAGAADADVVLVEFFDYACVYCRAANPDIERLLREDRRLKVVWREYPVLGPNSELAAIASLAAARSGRFRQFHARLFTNARPTEATIAAAQRSVGLGAGPAPLTDEFRGELERNFQLARAVGATGTPTFVIGDRVLQGAVGYRALRDAVEAARSRDR